MKLLRYCPTTPGAHDHALTRRRCALERGEPCRCPGGYRLVVDLDGDEREACEPKRAEDSVR